MKKSHGKTNNATNRQQRQQPTQQPAQDHPHPVTFKSGGCCKFKQHGDHFHAESAEDDGTIDKSLPHVYTKEEQNVLVWLVYRNRHKFARVKPNEPLLLMVPNVVPDKVNGFDDLEKNLGSDTAGLVKKIYALIPPQSSALGLAELCGMINVQPNLNDQVALIEKVIREFEYNSLKPLPSALRNFAASSGVTKTFLYFFTDQHLKFLEKAFDEFVSLAKRNIKGLSNYTRCTHFHHTDFPKMLKAASNEITTQAIATFDRISKLLPENSVVYDNPVKQSPGGWRCWETNQPGSYIALIYLTATNKLIGSKVAEALEFAFNTIGLKAKTSYNPKIEKPAIEVVFNPEKLESINFQQFDLKLSAILLDYQTPLQTLLSK